MKETGSDREVIGEGFTTKGVTKGDSDRRGGKRVKDGSHK